MSAQQAIQTAEQQRAERRRLNAQMRVNCEAASHGTHSGATLKLGTRLADNTQVRIPNWIQRKMRLMYVETYTASHNSTMDVRVTQRQAAQHQA